MSDQDEQGSSDNSDLREDYSLGHDVTWDISVDDLVHLQSEPFEKTYETFCETSPSEWRFKMSLPEVREDGTCSLSVLLERTDSLDIHLEACMWIYFCDPSDNLIFNKQAFTKTGMVPGDIIQKTVEMTPLPDMRDAIHRNAKVSVILMICYCHSDSESD